jgi:hypothetical protein
MPPYATFRPLILRSVFAMVLSLSLGSVATRAQVGLDHLGIALHFGRCAR